MSPEASREDVEGTREQVVQWRLVHEQQEAHASTTVADDAAQALRDWARVLADRIEMLSRRLDVPLSQDPEPTALRELQEEIEQFQSDWEPFIADSHALLRTVNDGHWQQSTKEHVTVHHVVDTFLAKLDLFRRLLGAIDLQHKLDLTADLERAERNIAMLQERRQQFAKDRVEVVAAVVPLLRAIARLA